MGFLETDYPEIFKHLHPKRNAQVDCAVLKSHSHEKVWWYCNEDPDCSHFFEDVIANRTKHGKFRCRICESAGGKRKDLLSHWDYQHYLMEADRQNTKICTLFDFGISSKFEAHWKCPIGHFEPKLISIAAKAVRGQGQKQKQRPICTRCHSIAVTHPKIAKLYDHEKNAKNIWDITAGVGDEVRWKCDQGHSYPMKVATKVKNFEKWSGNGCNICSGHLIVPDINSFAALFPKLLKEWHWEKNQKIGISPYDFGPGSPEKAYWICKKHKPYPASLGNRTHKTNPTGCPKCKSQTSRNELRIYFELKALVSRVEHRLRDYGKEIDIFLPDHLIGIEYDGLKWHAKTIDRDRKQFHDLAKKNIELIRVRERPLQKLGVNDLEVSSTKPISHDDIVFLLKKILKIGSKNYSASINESFKAYIQNGTFVAENEYVDTIINRFSVPFEDSLAAKFPNISAEWDDERNHPYKPDMITPGVSKNASGELFYWKCLKDPEHPSYPQAVYSRTGKSASGCPRCSGRFATSENNLRLKYPKQADMFDAGKNLSEIGEELNSLLVAPNSGTKYNWVCPKGHMIKSKSPDHIVKNKEYFGCNTCRRDAIKAGSHVYAHQKLDHEEIISLYKRSFTYEKIAKQVGCSLGQVGNIIVKFKRDNGIKVESKVTDAVFCKELNWHFHSHSEAKEELKELGYDADNILAVLRGDSKTTGGLSFTYSELTDDQIKNQNPANFVEFSVQKS